MPGIELLKWLGFAFMFYDHAAVFGGIDLPYAEAVGTFAFPFFVVALAAVMADKTPSKRRSVFARMWKWGFVAQAVCLLVRDPLPLNVLFTLASGLLLIDALDRWRTWRGAVVIAVLLLVGSLAEFSFVGVALVTVTIAVFQGRLHPAWMYGVSFLLFPFNSGQLLAPAAMWIAVALLESGPRLPRLQRAFYPLYAVQWVLLRVL